MATYTDNYNLVKPTQAESADIRTINGNMDSVDNIMHATQVSLAPAYDSSETYNTGDIVMYEFFMYECLDDDVTGTWDATKWQRTTAGEHGGGGGGSNVEITPTLQSGTKIADFEIDGVSGALYAPTGGGGGGGGISQTIIDVLWSGAETPRYPTTYTVNLPRSIKYYDILIFDGTETDYNQLIKYVIDTSSITYNEVYLQISDGDSGFAMTFIDDQTIELASYASSHPTTYTKITGLKFCCSLAPMIYSTEEREVGAWIDNKPLYQKTFDLTSQALTDNSWNNGILGTTGISIKSYKGYFTLGTGALFPYEYYRNSSEFFTAVTDTNSTDINARPNMNAGTPVYAGIVTVWYTKDSDVAGSGSYSSLGVPMEHYDTEERVVGTWLGETLYQKTFNVSSLSCTTSDYFGSYSGSLDLSGYIGNFEDVFVDLNMSYLITSGGVKERFVLTQAPPNSTSLYLFTCASRSNVSAVLTVRYTKSTT